MKKKKTTENTEITEKRKNRVSLSQLVDVVVQCLPVEMDVNKLSYAAR